MLDSLQYGSTTCAPQYEYTSFVTMATYWFQTSLVLKVLLAAFAFFFDICQWYLICMIQQAYKYVRLSLWPFQMFFLSMKSPKIRNQIGETGKE